MGEHKNIAGLRTCHICGRDFPLVEEEHYIARDVMRTGLNALANGVEPVLYDVIDCPHCGCQVILQQRKRLANLNDIGVELPNDEEGEE